MKDFEINADEQMTPYDVAECPSGMYRNAQLAAEIAISNNVETWNDFSDPLVVYENYQFQKFGYCRQSTAEAAGRFFMSISIDENDNVTLSEEN